MTSSDATLRPYKYFRKDEDAGRLYRAMKGIGTNETMLIEVLFTRTSEQRQEIVKYYKHHYGKDLLESIQSETSGEFKNICKCALISNSYLLAHDVRKAIEGAGTDEETLIEVLCSQTNEQMDDLKTVYREKYQIELEKDVSGDVSGHFKRLLCQLITAQRSTAIPNVERAIETADELYEAGMGRIGTDEAAFNRIFASESLAQLRLVFSEYQKKTGHDIEKAIKSEMSGYIEQALLTIVEIVKNKPAYFARRLYECMKGAGTRDRNLMRIMVVRSEIDMVLIKKEFLNIYGKPLEYFIKHDTSGNYRRALLCLAGDPSWK